MYFTGDRLRMHRSWGGALIHDLGFRSDSTGGASVTEAIVNRDPEQYGNTDDAEDLRLIEELIQGHLLTPLEEPASDGFVQGAMLASKPNYLGSPEVVSALVGQVFEVAVRGFKNEATTEDQNAVMWKVIAALTEDGSGYTRMPGWHSADQMGAWVRKYLIESPATGQDPAENIAQGICNAEVTHARDGRVETLAQILDSGFAALFAKLQEMLMAFVEDPVATWQDHALVQLNALHECVVAVLLGTNTLSYGEKTLGDFHWKAVAATAVDERRCIVRLAGEGGEITLFGIPIQAGWKFRVEVEESALLDLIDDDDPLPVVERPWVSTWRSALRQLDSYPWVQMQPLEVDEDFVSKVHKALQTRYKKGLPIPWDEWHGVLQMKSACDVEQSPLHAELQTLRPAREQSGGQVDGSMSNAGNRLGSGFEFQAGKADGRPILASLEVTSDLLRKLTFNALARRGDFVEGKLEGSVAQAKDIEESRALADLFMGKGPMAADYVVHPWNSVDEVGRFLVESYSMDCQPNESVFTMLISLITAVYGELDFIERNKLDIEEQEWRFDGQIEMFAHALTGIPYPPTE